MHATDALQLAAAVLSGQQPLAMELVCLDARLVIAAEKEGFHVTGYSER
ncbi:MAG: hypothetical protein OEP48_06525 [Betaproteobacteria bacterium]|nr:hypothetical protein [Betaproteobacteria bacterium]MDH3436659.1 hypothetical protein [Betaproteobacteria bacterium]